MDNFEEQFLEQLAKARARLEGKEAYDDEAIAKEFDPDLKPEKTDNTMAEKKAKPTGAKTNAAEKSAVEAAKKVEPEVSVKAPVKEKKRVNAEKFAVIWGAVTVAVSLIISSLVQFVSSTSGSWVALKAYMPFIGLVFGASAAICGALFIKNNKKGTVPLILGIVAILISAILPSL